MFRNRVSLFLVVGFAVILSGFFAGCGEEQVKDSSPELEVVAPVVKDAEPKTVVDAIVEPVVEVAAAVVAPVVEVTTAVIAPVVAVVAPAPVKTRVAFLTDANDIEIVIELDREKAPITVRNFLRYVNEGFYDGLVIHRVVPKFMIQMGGFDQELAEKQTHYAIKNESSNGLGNLRGTVAMARQTGADTATSQFFINLKNNAFLNYGGSNRAGYTVFGKVVEGMEVVDAIAKVKTTTKRVKDNPLMKLEDSPVEIITIISAKIVKNTK
jgi:peptidyl-prolyl cis-trans isomerase A (cyclophilin A)